MNMNIRGEMMMPKITFDIHEDNLEECKHCSDIIIRVFNEWIPVDLFRHPKGDLITMHKCEPREEI